MYRMKTESKSMNTVRCESIEERLNDKGVQCAVWRHTIFGINCYAVVGKEKAYFNEKDIAEALNIPMDWISLVEVDPRIKYYIKEEEFNGKYCDSEGYIDFSLGMDFKGICEENRSKFNEINGKCPVVESFIEKKCDIKIKDYRIDNGKFFFKVKNESAFFNRVTVRNKLDIDSKAVSCYYDGIGWIYVIDVWMVMD